MLPPALPPDMKRASRMPGPVKQELDAGWGDNSKRMEYLEHSVNALSSQLGELAMQLGKLGEDQGNFSLKVHELAMKTKDCDRKLTEMDREQRAHAMVIERVDPQIKRAEQKARVMIERVQAVQEQVLVAINHHSDRIIELRRELRRLSAGKTDQPVETRIVPYKQQDVVLYNPPDDEE